jgi:hypothetical protein
VNNELCRIWKEAAVDYSWRDWGKSRRNRRQDSPYPVPYRTAEHSTTSFGRKDEEGGDRD